jgi:hypothetical protein
MKIIRVCLICLLLFSVVVTQVSAKEWRGIVPLKSTRADVERLIGPPTCPRCSDYSLKDEHVSILYADSGCNIPPDTVLNIHVPSSDEQTLSKSGFDLSKFKLIWHKDSHTPDLIYYVNDEEGISLESRKGLDIILAVEYYATAKEAQEYHCSKQQKD